MAMGFPVLADFQSGAFYPPHLLFFILPFFAAIRIIFVLHFLIAMVGSYKLLRYWSYPCYLSILGALLFTLGGTLVSLSNLLNHFQTAVWLPWVLLFWEEAIRAGSWKRFVALVLILAVQFLAGSPELFALSLVIVVIDGFRIKTSEPDIPYGRIILIFVCANFLVVGLTMVQLLPTAELFLESRRVQPIPLQETLQWSLQPQGLLNLFFLDKEVDSSASVGIRFFFAKEAAFFVSYYLGAISIFGICLWLCSGPLRKKISALLLIAVSLIFALGHYTPVYPFLLHHSPMLGAMRFPEKFFYVTYVLLIYIALNGIAEFIDRDKQNSKKAMLVLSIVCVALVGTYLYIRWDFNLVAHFIAEKTGIHPASAENSKMVASVLASLERQIILSLALLVLFALVKFEKIRQSLFAFLLVSTTFVDLAWAHRDYLFPINPDFTRSSARILHEPDHKPTRVFYYPSGGNLHP
ncbi:MAG: hypothetical protein WD688_16825, partial [Candidatus Binatia bacterium]